MIDMEVGDRIRIKKLQLWAEEYGVYIGDEDTPVGRFHKLRLDNGQLVLQSRGHFIVIKNEDHPRKEVI
jgi:hypothetical protein